MEELGVEERGAGARMHTDMDDMDMDMDVDTDMDMDGCARMPQAEKCAARPEPTGGGRRATPRRARPRVAVKRARRQPERALPAAERRRPEA